ncbi:MAG: hypothetical protein ACKJSK_09290, partial [Roseibacillus sp.]
MDISQKTAISELPRLPRLGAGDWFVLIVLGLEALGGWFLPLHLPAGESAGGLCWSDRLRDGRRVLPVRHQVAFP